MKRTKTCITTKVTKDTKEEHEATFLLRVLFFVLFVAFVVVYVFVTCYLLRRTIWFCSASNAGPTSASVLA